MDAVVSLIADGSGRSAVRTELAPTQKTGGMIGAPGCNLTVLVDEAPDSGRGIMFCNAGGITAADVNMMATHGRALIGAVLSRARAFALDLAPMRGAQPRIGRPQFLASVEAAACTETGISAHERALTLGALGDWSSTPASFHSPGHVFPAVPAENPTAWQISDIAYHFCGIRTGALATAWCDILDSRGNVASANWCRDLAHTLGLTLITTGEALAAINADPALYAA